ncbi:DUF2242 domain-containing protein [Paucibacter sediminis]|uniref:DUF2242 domain-containing protein n=1 Tax=Paucibacter sediminis TaxID=3019553 RepID=A0AA95SY48_9BURK|nr:DUF2242 domain-containing protein [Paucibacter sp. S2-9]WIT13369.1 DUF2242 domain-containing protein [Paucibacter sp. S2-9]
MLMNPPALRALLPACYVALSAALLAGCGLSSPLKSPPKPSVYQNEKFQADETFSRLFDAGVGETCEAARRALLSQGYVITNANTGMVMGAKRFQPDGEEHVEISFNVVCVPDGRNSQIATAFVSAQQDRYVIKKSANATSIGVSALGSISVPLSSSQDSLVKIASETIPAGAFYDRYFALMQRMLREQAADQPQ